MIYQTAADKVRERETARRLALAWGGSVVEFPPLAPIDWYLQRGQKLAALIEIKGRGYTHAAYATVYLDVLKFWSLHFGAMAFGVPAFYVLQYTDGIYAIDVARVIGLPVSVRGRTDRGHPGDVHPCLDIPVSLLTAVP